MSYPSDIDTFTTKVDRVTKVQAAHINTVQTAIVAIETELGTTPKGGSASVGARIGAIETELGSNPSGAYADVAARLAATREKLTGSRTYYVRTDGSDSNDGLSNTAGGAFLTIQRAVDVIAGLDINAQNVTVQIADGTYTTPVLLKNTVGFAAPGNLVIQGNAGTPANVIISTTGADAFTADSLYVVWDIKDLKIITTTSGRALLASNGAVLRFANLNFGAVSGAGGYHVSAEQNGMIVCIGNYTISGNAVRHWNATTASKLICGSRTITLTGTPAFSGAFAYANINGSILGNANTFSGSATGSRYSANANSVIYTAAGTLPGDSAGTTATGGQYI